MRFNRYVAACAVAASLTVPAAAQAGTLTTEGDQIVYRAAPGETNRLTMLADDDGTLIFNDAAPMTLASDDCTGRYGGRLQCRPLPGGLRMELGDGDDRVILSDYMTGTIVVDGGSGNDHIEGPNGDRVDTFLGGDGDDELLGGGGDDLLDGGPGNDDLDGSYGRDALSGGPGDDQLRGDNKTPEPDVLDGGPGLDRIADAAYNAFDGDPQAAISITLDGRANDGRPGEGDNVIDVELFRLLAPATLVAGAQGVAFEVFRTVAGGSTLTGGPAADRLTGFDYDDRIDGKAGDDVIMGSYGNDTITGGPGRDQIHGDTNAACNWAECRPPYGNDTIYAADGERDEIECGVGNDTAYVDRKDRVSGCEKVVVKAAKKPKKRRKG
jgi:Ca2+-binding RTX toxin-like protein